MLESYDTERGSTLLFNSDLRGNITIIRGRDQITVPAECLREFSLQVLKKTPITAPPQPVQPTPSSKTTH